LERLISKGGYGKIFQVKETKTNQLFALKLFEEKRAFQKEKRFYQNFDTKSSTRLLQMCGYCEDSFSIQKRGLLEKHSPSVLM